MFLVGLTLEQFLGKLLTPLGLSKKLVSERSEGSTPEPRGARFFGREVYLEVAKGSLRKLIR
ncbi:MAG: hypothetical protein A2W36_03465 [Chloroflexi bacterium RBG_16_58_14]|nr:MAG: hypothetical protein A2W36_03465 [Chloroflexi bacterium RBG_16_58_14]